MFDIEGILKVPGLAALMSIVIGFGIACMFRPLCKGPECLIVRGPPISDLRGSVYQFGSKCVEFTPKPVECPTSKTVTVVDTVTFTDYN
jgi:hypothetical protein